MELEWLETGIDSESVPIWIRVDMTDCFPLSVESARDHELSEPSIEQVMAAWQGAAKEATFQFRSRLRSDKGSMRCGPVLPVSIARMRSLSNRIIAAIIGL